MATVWNFHRPLGNAATASRDLSLEQEYADKGSQMMISGMRKEMDKFAHEDPWKLVEYD